VSYSVSLSSKFQKEAKRLSKKYPSLKLELLRLIESIEENPTQGDALGWLERTPSADRRKG
jgi:mRNA-degrading endonuclease RelE of RelBE toxin-antitoxin system